MIEKYGNKHTVETFSGRTAYSEESYIRSGSGSRRNKDKTPDSKSNKNNKSSVADDFSSAVALTTKRGNL